MRSKIAALHRITVGSEPYTGQINSTDHLNEKDPYSAGIRCLENAGRFDREGNYTEALEEVTKAVDHFGNYLSDVNDSFNEDRNSRARIDVATITSATKNLDIAKLKRTELQEKIKLEEGCRITVLATIFGVQGLKSDDARYLEARSEVYRILGIPDGTKREILEKAIKLAEVNLRLADKDLVTENDAAELIKNGYVLDDEMFKGKSVRQWVDEITLKFNPSNGVSENHEPVQVLPADVIDPIRLQTDDVLPADNVAVSNVTDTISATVTAGDKVSMSGSDATCVDELSRGTTTGATDTVSNLSADDTKGKITLPELSELVNNSPDNDLISLSAKLVCDGVLDGK